MIYKSKIIETKQKVLINLFITHQAMQQEYGSASELFFFLLHYSFLLQDNETTRKICTLKIAQFHILQRNGENGARYLDPKYSRWISMDPALSYYVEGKSNGSSRGIYNSINLNLYHYANNNPIRYCDPTGLEIEEGANISRQMEYLSNIVNAKYYSLQAKADASKALRTEMRGSLDAEMDKGTYNYETNTSRWYWDWTSFSEHEKWDMDSYFRQWKYTPLYRSIFGHDFSIPGYDNHYDYMYKVR